MTWIRAFGRDYYLDEEDWSRRMTKQSLEGLPWRMEEILAIQQQMKETEDRIFEHVRATATPDPLDTLRKHLDEMLNDGAQT